MAKEEKVKAVDELADTLSKSSIAIVTENKGVPANATTQLRKVLRDAGVEYRVVKNTLMIFAAEKVNKQGIKPLLKGPTAIAFGTKGETATAKVLTDYIRTSGAPLKIKGAILGTQVLDAKQVAALTMLPPREVLIADLLGKMKSPITATVFILGSPLRGMVGVLQARARQLESQQPAS
ncbi:MAG: 50S ribosomal protein L10 [Dehalococcoidia bacterium]|nr:50S ribosomal protein L10 [Dehalococcoidia bacterium]